jgi:hypothetical protein
MKIAWQLASTVSNEHNDDIMHTWMDLAASHFHTSPNLISGIHGMSKLAVN